MKAQCDMHLQPACPTIDRCTCSRTIQWHILHAEALFTLETSSLQYMCLILIQIQELKSLAEKCTSFVKYLL